MSPGIIVAEVTTLSGVVVGTVLGWIGSWKQGCAERKRQAARSMRESYARLFARCHEALEAAEDLIFLEEELGAHRVATGVSQNLRLQHVQELRNAWHRLVQEVELIELVETDFHRLQLCRQLAESLTQLDPNIADTAPTLVAEISRRRELIANLRTQVRESFPVVSKRAARRLQASLDLGSALPGHTDLPPRTR